jgi:ADP-ribose pyrophosphatase
MPAKPPPLPSHADVEYLGAEMAHSRYLHLQIVRFRHRLFAGGWSGECVFDVVRRGAATAVLLYDPRRDNVVMIEQFRLGALLAGTSPWQLEPVGGMIESGETPDATAIREAGEESGLALIGDVIAIGHYLPSPSASDEYLHLFCARVDSRPVAHAEVRGVAEEQEHIRVVVKPMSEIEALVDGGTVESCHSLVLLQWLLRHRDRLRQLWGVD